MASGVAEEGNPPLYWKSARPYGYPHAPGFVHRLPGAPPEPGQRVPERDASDGHIPGGGAPPLRPRSSAAAAVPELGRRGAPRPPRRGPRQPRREDHATPFARDVSQRHGRLLRPAGNVRARPPP